MTEQKVLRAPVVLPGPTGPPIRDGAVLIRKGRIVAVGTYPEIREAAPHASRADHGGTVLLPGLVDGHSHARGLSVVAFGNGRGHSRSCA